MKNLTWQNPEQLFVAQELINKVKSKCCGIKVIIFIRSYNVMFFKTNDWSLRTPCFAITTICMLSSFVEPYIQSIHAVFGVYCYLIMASLCGIIHCSRTSLFARL